MMNAINDWRKPIQKVKLMFKFFDMPVAHELPPQTDIARLEPSASQALSPSSLPAETAPLAYPIFAMNIPSTEMTPSQKDLTTTFKMLYRATINQQSAEVNEVLLNMELLAFSITWFGQVRSLVVS
jgi:hypothetical protein